MGDTIVWRREVLLKDKGVLEEGRMETHIFDSELRILFTVGTVSCGGSRCC